MNSHDGRYTVVFNGEIYNYKELRQELRQHGHSFHTDTDTEVLIVAWAQWGIDAVPRFVGMFAFAMYDSAQQSLTLVRDAFGIKPLFYTRKQNELAFASELPALLALFPSRPGQNLQSVYSYLVFGNYDSGNSTFFDDVQHLAPGHTLQIDLRDPGSGQPERWWWPSIQERRDITFADAAEQLRELFLKNVRLHLRADVPVGAALSGGLDSSAVVCAMRHIEPEMPIHTFSYVARGSEVDEEHWVDIVNAHVGAIPHKVVVDPNDLVRDLDDMIRAQGEPFGSTSIYAQYRVFKAAREAGIVVTLDGQGADELLAGYHGYPQGAMLSMVEQGRLLELARFLRNWSAWPGRSMKSGLIELGAALIPQWARKAAYGVLGRSSAPPWINSELLAKSDVVMRPPAPPAKAVDGQGRRLAEQLRSALTGNGLAALLRHGDRNSMRWSIESRVPFLTTEMAEFLLRLPESYLLSPRGETKHVFRAAMRGIVPDAILDRRDKIGFQTPENDWLRSQGDAVRRWVDASGSEGILEPSHVKSQIDDPPTRRYGAPNQTWLLINYCRWAAQL